MYVCVCRRITDRQIRQLAEQGTQTLDELQRTLGVGSQCGKCTELAHAILIEAQDEALAKLYYPAA